MCEHLLISCCWQALQLKGKTVSMVIWNSSHRMKHTHLDPRTAQSWSLRYFSAFPPTPSPFCSHPGPMPQEGANGPSSWNSSLSPQEPRAEDWGGITWIKMGCRPSLEGGTRETESRNPRSKEKWSVSRWWLCCVSRKQDHGQRREDSLRTVPGNRRSDMRRPEAPRLWDSSGNTGTRDHFSLPLSTLRPEGPWMME